MAEREIVVFSVSSLFLTRVGMYVGVGVFIHIHTHTHCIYGVLGCETRGLDETPGGPEEYKWIKTQHKCISICVKSTHVYVYARSQDKISDQLHFSFNIFSLSKKKSKRCIHKLLIISNVQ